MSDLRGRTFFVTGASGGIGRVTAEQIAQRGARVLLACRSPARARPVLEGIRAVGGDAALLELDLADLESVRRCARGVLDTGAPVDVLINNAGTAARGTTRQGFELTFGTNHLGHFLLTTLLLPLLAARSGARVVNVSSHAHYGARSIDFAALRQPTRTLLGVAEYRVSKLCNVLFTQELARRHPQLRTYALHPGVVATNIWRRVPALIRPVLTLFMIAPAEGARATLHCATSPAVANETGLYYGEDGRARAPNRLADDPTLARRLWEESASFVET